MFPCTLSGDEKEELDLNSPELPVLYFGPFDWRRHFGIKVSQKILVDTAALKKELEKPCPSGASFTTKEYKRPALVSETHILWLGLREIVSGTSLTLSSLYQLGWSQGRCLFYNGETWDKREDLFAVQETCEFALYLSMLHPAPVNYGSYKKQVSSLPRGYRNHSAIEETLFQLIAIRLGQQEYLPRKEYRRTVSRYVDESRACVGSDPWAGMDIICDHSDADSFSLTTGGSKVFPIGLVKQKPLRLT